MLKILITDENAGLRATIRQALESKNCEVHEAVSTETALTAWNEQGGFQVAVISSTTPGEAGFELLTAIKSLQPDLCCIVLASHYNVEDAITAIKLGAYDYLEKPADIDRILKIIDSSVAASSSAEAANRSAPSVQCEKGRTIIGASTPIRKVFDLINKLSKVETSVLIRGESGTGKELVAKALHYNSERRKGPFVAVNCGAIPENLIESELFGHEKGTFTGADKRKIGRFQFASGGTIFLDEIGDISAQMQVKLLRVLQEKRFNPVGSNQEIAADVRIISATNKNLEEMIKKDEFRADLFYRLNVLPIHLPALRERTEDIHGLVEFMIDKFNKIHRRSITSISEVSLAALRKYPWPGNIRELENVIEHAFIIESSDEIQVDSLPNYINRDFKNASSAEALEQPSGSAISRAGASSNPDSEFVSNGIIDDFSELKYPLLKERFEQEFIRRALKAHGGKINQTAEKTEMTKVTLLRKLEKYQINPKEYRPN